MHILYIHQHFTTPEGAGGTRSFEYSKQLVKEGHSVTLVCGSHENGISGLNGQFVRGVRKGVVDNINIIEMEISYSSKYNFLKRSVIFFKFAWKSTIIALTMNYDLIFCTSTPLTVAIPGILSHWLRNKVFVFEVRDLWPELPKEMGVISNPFVLMILSFLEWVSYRSADACIGLSPGIVEGIERRGVKPAKIEMIPNGSDIDLHQISPKRDGENSHRKDDVLQAVFTGAHGIANGLNAVVNTAVELQARGRHDVKFNLIGNGMLKPELMERARKEKLTNIEFNDPISKYKLVEELKTMDVGLMILADIPAFYYGTSPNKFFDYIASGLPILINYPGWLASLVEERECGIYVPPGDPAAFADAMEHLAENRDNLKVMGDNAYQLALTEFERGKLSKKFIDLLTKTYQNEKNS